MMRLYHMFRYINITSKGHLGRIAVLLKWRVACPKSSHYAAYTRYWTGTSFVQIIVCHLFQNKQLSKATINHPRNSLQSSDNYKISKLTNLYWRKVLFMQENSLVVYSNMMLVKFRSSANQKHWIWSCDETGLYNPRHRLLGDEVILGSSLMFRKMDAWNVNKYILQDRTREKSTVKRNGTLLVGKLTFLIKLVLIRKTWIYLHHALMYGTWILFEKFYL